MEPIESYIQVAAHALVADLSPLFVVLPQDADPSTEADWAASEAACHRAFATWYQRMLESPDSFGLPQVPYPQNADAMNREIRSFAALSKIRAPELEPLRRHAKQLSRARSALRGPLQWLLTLGANGELAGEALWVDADAFASKTPADAFLRGLASCGWRFSQASDGVQIIHADAPEMMPALQALCRACATSKKRQYLFARCDFRALNLFYRWTLVDVLRPLPEADGQRLLALDDTLRSIGYRRVIEFENRYAYLIKSSVIFRVEREADTYHFYFRWPLNDEKTADALAAIGEASPELRARVFEEMIPCRPDCAPGYGAASAEACGARFHATLGDRVRVGCVDQGWPVWGHEKADFTAIETVARTLYPLLRGA